MKVLLIGSAGRYGAQLSLLYLCRELKKRNIDVMVVLPERSMEQIYVDSGIPCQIIKNGLDWYKTMNPIKNAVIYAIKRVINARAEYKINKIISRNKIDIVHINSIGICVGAKSALKNKSKLVWHIREFVEEDLDRKLYNTNKTYSLVKKADSIIAISQVIFQKYKEVLNPDRMIIIQNGIDETFYEQSKHMAFQNEVLKVIFVGRIAKEKGQYLLLDALQYIPDFYKTMVVEFIGDGNGEDREKKRLMAIVSKNKWEKCIEFSGYSQNIANKFREADICVVASQKEAFGRVTVEAMMAGVLVIGTNSGCTAELLSEKRGILFKQGDARELAEKIKYATEHKLEMIEFVNRARDYVLENCTAEKNAERIVGVYDAIVSDAIF